MATIMSLEDRLQDLTSIAMTSLENMFRVPIDKTMMEFTHEFDKGLGKKNIDNILTSDASLLLVILASITPVDYREFDSSEYAQGDDMASVNSLYSFNVVYTYNDFFVGLYYAARNFYEVINQHSDSIDDEIIEAIREACQSTKDAYLTLRPDSVKKMLTTHDMLLICAMYDCWRSVFDLLIESDDEEEGDE